MASDESETKYLYPGIGIESYHKRGLIASSLGMTVTCLKTSEAS